MIVSRQRFRNACRSLAWHCVTFIMLSQADYWMRRTPHSITLLHGVAKIMVLRYWGREERRAVECYWWRFWQTLIDFVVQDGAQDTSYLRLVLASKSSGKWLVVRRGILNVGYVVARSQNFCSTGQERFQESSRRKPDSYWTTPYRHFVRSIDPNNRTKLDHKLGISRKKTHRRFKAL